MKINRILFARAEVSAGSLSPQLLIQITPLHWGLAVSVQCHNRWPVKLAVKVGPVAVVICGYEYDFQFTKCLEKSLSATFERDDAEKT